MRFPRACGLGREAPAGLDCERLRAWIVRRLRAWTVRRLRADPVLASAVPPLFRDETHRVQGAQGSSVRFVWLRSAWKLLHTVETSHPVENKHVSGMFSFSATKSFHVNVPASVSGAVIAGFGGYRVPVRVWRARLAAVTDTEPRNQAQQRRPGCAPRRPLAPWGCRYHRGYGVVIC